MKANGETPEHNRLQMLFHRAQFRERFIRILYGLSPQASIKLLLLDFECKRGRRWLDVKIIADIRSDGFYPWQRYINVEIKRRVGDDFPCVLRQMRATGANVLFLEKYVGVGASEGDFIRTFHQAGIQIVYHSDVMEDEKSEEEELREITQQMYLADFELKE